MESIHDDVEPIRTKRSPATTPEAVEKRMIGLAVARAEQQIRDGTVSATVLAHYLKLATSRERLEQEKLKRENELLAAKSEAIESAKRVEDLYKEALNAMRAYRGEDEYYED